MRKVFIALFLLLIAGAALAQECSVGVSQAKELIFEIQLNSEGKATALEKMTIPYPQECALEKGLSSATREINCNAFGNSFNELSQEFAQTSNCTVSYNDKNQLIVDFSSQTGIISREQGGRQIAGFGKISTQGLDSLAQSTLRISLPEGFALLDYAPKEKSISTKAGVFWMEIPKEQITLQYRASANASESMNSIIAAIAIILAVCVLAFGMLFKERKDSFVAGIESKEKEIEKKQKQATGLLAGKKISQAEFKKTSEKNSDRLLELKAKKAKALEKKKTGTGKLEELKAPSAKKQ